MKRDEHGRRLCRFRHRFPEGDENLGNHAGDNLAPTQDDEPDDENESFNWVNNPIRRLFDNPFDSSHRSYLEEPSFPEEP